MGAIRPWHLAVLLCCLLVVTGVTATIALVANRNKQRKPPGGP